MDTSTLFVTPLHLEARAVSAGLARDGAASVLEVGAGPASAERLRRCLRGRRPGLVVVAGFGGGLDAALAPGALVLASSLIASNGDVRATPARDLEDARSALGRARVEHTVGPILSVQEPLLAPAQKRDARQRTAALTVDTESWWLCAAAGDAGVPCLVVRSVVDTVEHVLPPYVAALPPGPALRQGLGVAAGVVRHPGSAGSLLRLIRASAAARRSLTRLAEALG